MTSNQLPEDKPQADEAIEPTEASQPGQDPKANRGSQRWMLGLVVLALIALFWPRGGSTVAPDGNLLDEMSQEIPLRPDAERVTLVHFWSTWCPPCIDEIPTLGRLIRDYESQPDLRVALIAVDDSPEKVKPFLGSLSAPVLYDPSWKLAHRYGTRKLPETHLVVDGQVVETFAGATNWDDPTIRRKIEDALREPAPGS